MGGQAIDLSAGLVPKQQSVDLSAGLVPKASAPPPKQEGFFHSLAAQFGLTPEQAQQDLADRDAHPVKSLLKDLMGPGGQVLKGLYDQGKVSLGEITQAVHDAGKNNAAALSHAVQAVPVVGPALNKASEQANIDPSKGYLGRVGDVVSSPGAMGTLVGASAQAAPMVAGAIEKVPGGSNILSKAAEPVQGAAEFANRVPSAVSQGAERAKRTLYPQNVSVPQQQIAAQNLVKAMVPDKPAIPNIKSAAVEIPDALASAQKNGTVINGKLDMKQALEDRAAEVQGHYDENILKPNAGDLNKVPENYNGATTTNGRATLTQINDRVDSINSELKSNFRKKLASQTVEANASDADLIAEKQGLTSILHDRLADLTGLQPEDIASLRQRAGKLRSLAQEVGVSADRDTTLAGTRQTSGGSMSIKNPLEGVIDHLSGGQEVIGNRVFKTALEKFQPAENPLPQPKAPGPDVPTTPEAAQKAFLHSQQLEQSAQDAAAQRGQQANAARLDNKASSAPQRWVSQGYTKVVDHLANDPSSGITRAQLVELQNTPAGRSLMVRASGLTPGSPAMRSIVSLLKKEVK